MGCHFSRPFKFLGPPLSPPPNLVVFYLGCKCEPHRFFFQTPSTPSSQARRQSCSPRLARAPPHAHEAMTSARYSQLCSCSCRAGLRHALASMTAARAPRAEALAGAPLRGSHGSSRGMLAKASIASRPHATRRRSPRRVLPPWDWEEAVTRECSASPPKPWRDGILDEK